MATGMCPVAEASRGVRAGPRALPRGSGESLRASALQAWPPHCREWASLACRPDPSPHVCPEGHPRVQQPLLKAQGTPSAPWWQLHLRPPPSGQGHCSKGAAEAPCWTGAHNGADATDLGGQLAQDTRAAGRPVGSEPWVPRASLSHIPAPAAALPPPWRPLCQPPVRASHQRENVASFTGWMVTPPPQRAPNPELQSRDRNLRSVYPAGWLSLFSTQCFHLRTAPSRETPHSRTRRRPGGRGPGEGLTLQRVQTLLHHARESPLGYTDRRGTGRKDGSRDYRCDLKFPSTYRVPGTPKDPTPWAPDEPEDWALGGEA